ncbi:protein TASOR [Oryzias melastigma]|uniref:protein TASOR n=1 Tax=Oryzias melastigma TaxID=30732 RepID=UPI000CF7EA31|nr:protein TASOR [Oryzias melastigma]
MEKPPGSSCTFTPEPPAAGSCTSPSVIEEEKEAEELKPSLVEETHVKLHERQEERVVLGGSRQTELLHSARALRPSASSCSVDTTVDRNLGDFSSGIQLLLQEEGVDYNSHQPSALHSETSTSFRMLPYAPIPRLSHYVTFYNPSPPVQDYVVSLQSSFSGMMATFEGIHASQKADAGHTDASLASTVQDFVASVRAANAPTGRDDASSVCSDHAELLAGGELWQSESADWSPHPGVAMLDLSSGSGLVYESANVMETGIKRTENTRPNASITHEVEKDVPTGPWPTPSEHPCKPCSSAAPAPEPELSPETAPSSKDLNSVIHQLQPDVLNNLLEIIKDIKKNSPQFYIHCPEPRDRVCEEVKELLLRLGNVQQSPVDFLSQESTETGLLVVVRNKDVAAHVHEVCPSVFADTAV